MADKSFDCVVVGSCVVDVLARPVTLAEPIGRGRLIEGEPLLLTTGGIVSNAGIAMSRLGMRVAAFTYVGDDEWADVIRRRYAAEGIDTSSLMTHPERATSTSAVLIDPSGERSFLHCAGAPRWLDRDAMLARLDLFGRSRVMLLGYYPLMTRLQNDLTEVLAAILDMLAYGLISMDEFRAPDEIPDFDAMMEAIALLLDRALLPAAGGSASAGRAIIHHFATAALAQFEQASKAE